MDPTAVHTRKSFLRSKLRHILSRMPEAGRIIKSRKIANRLLKSRLFRDSLDILCYSALSAEVQTKEIVMQAMAAKKNVYMPRVDLRKKRIEIYQITHWPRDLKKGAYGILEPGVSQRKKGNPGRLDLVIAPGLGFDPRGVRLGRGGGYFDRFLKKAARAKKVGLAFREQIVRKIPKASHDVPMDGVVTDKECFGVFSAVRSKKRRQGSGRRTKKRVRT